MQRVVGYYVSLIVTVAQDCHPIGVVQTALYEQVPNNVNVRAEKNLFKQSK